MRRVFPLRPSETSLLVSYRNGAYELDDDAEATVSSSSSNLKSSSTPRGSHRRRSSTNFSVTFCEDKDSHALQRKTSQESPSSAYPEFVEAASPSARSSLWSCSFRDDGDSTSFNLSDGTHRRATSSLSSSSSSSITYNPRGSASFRAMCSNKIADASSDMTSSASEDVNSHIGTDIAACKDPISHLIELPTAPACSAKLALEPLTLPSPLSSSSQQRSRIQDVTRKVQENMHVCRDTSTSHRLSQCAVSSPKAAARRLQTSTNGCLRQSRESLSNPRAASVSWKSYSCTPLKYLTTCLRTDKSSKSPEKERSISFRVRSPTKFSTNLNQLYSPVAPSQDLMSPKGRATGETENTPEESLTAKNSHPSTPRLRVQESVNDGCAALEEGRQSSLRCQSFGTSMITEYVRHVHEVGKSSSFRKSPETFSLRYDSDSGSSKEFKSRSFSIDRNSKAGKGSSNCAYDKKANGKYVDQRDHNRLRDIFAAEEKNTRNLDLLRLEISKLCKDKRLLARELAAETKARHAEQKAADIAIKNVEVAMEEKLISAEKDHAYVQACLEKEMDRRKKEWSAKLDKIRLEEKKLRERVTEMALERVELQKSIAFYKGREAFLQSQAKDHELCAQAWMRRHHQSEEEVLLLRQSFMSVCNKLRDKEQELDLVLQRSKVLERENAEILKEFSRLRRAYADQDSMFEGLWQRLLDIVNGTSDCKVESLRRLHGELKVFAVREQALRYEIAVLQSQLFNTKQKTGPATEDSFFLLEGNRIYSPNEHPSFSKKLSPQHKKDVMSESLNDLVKKLDLAKQHVWRVEHQLEVKEEEVELLQSTLKERDHAMEELQEEFMLVKMQRDGLRKQVQQMGHEALDLSLELSELRKVVEKMDDELMLKEGQISILRDTCSDSDF